jgi:hypothetical protein
MNMAIITLMIVGWREKINPLTLTRALVSMMNNLALAKHKVQIVVPSKQLLNLQK